MLIKKLNAASYEQLSQQHSLEIPENFNFAFDVLDDLAVKNPGKLAIKHVDDNFVCRDYSFGDLAAASARAAAAFKALGIGKGDRVVLILYRRIEWWQCFLGLQKLGAVAVMSPAQLSAEDISFRCNMSQAKAIIVDETMTDRVDQAKSQCPSLSIMIEAAEDKPPKTGWHNLKRIMDAAQPHFPKPQGPDYAGGQDSLLIFFSSGTTGMPKMVHHTHEYPLGHLFTGLYWHDLNEGDLHLSLADSGWSKALWGKAYGQWMAGAAVFVYDFRGKFKPATLLKVMAEHKVTTFCAPPTVYRFLVRENLNDYDLSSLRHCTTAGELLNDSVFYDWQKATGLPIYEGFGQTETTLQIATLPCMVPKPGSIGRPVPGWEIELLDEDGLPAPIGEEGEICIKISGRRPTGLFIGYLGEDDLNAKVMRDGWYHTGDKAWMDEDGYYWFLGRVDDLIKTSGYRVGPYEVESALVSHPAIIEAAVTAVPDPLRGQSIKATVVLAPGYNPGEELTRELQGHVKNVTAPYKYPRIIEYVAELPKTISGKIKRAEIRNQDRRKAA